MSLSLSTQDIDNYAHSIVTVISTALNQAIPTFKSELPESQLISAETVALVKDRRRLRCQYFQVHDLLVKTHIDQSQK